MVSVSQTFGIPYRQRMTSSPGVHPIRLRGPWRYAWQDAPQITVGTMRHPEEWPRRLAEGGRVIELTRRFHAPSNVEDDERVFVVLTGVCGRGEARLNGQLLGSFTPEETQWEFELPRPLPFANELALTLSFAAPESSAVQVGLYDVVVLEIRGPQKKEPGDAVAGL